MSDSKDQALVGGVKGFFTTLKSSYLVMLLAGLFVADFFILDPIPYVDEAVLFIITVLVARWKSRQRSHEPEDKPPPKDVTPPSPPE